MIRRSKYPLIADPSKLGVQLIAPITPRNGGWSGDNQLGYMAKYAPDRRGTQTILKLDEWGPPEVWTLSLLLDQKFANFDGFNIWAEINYGAGGSSQRIDVDWINGAQISLPLNAVNVIAHFEDIDVNTEGQGLSLGVQIARGARGGTNPPVRTIVEARSIANGVIDEIFEIPPFAKNVVMISSDPTLTELAVFYTANILFSGLSGNSGVGIHTTVAVDGTRAPDGRLVLPVNGQTKFVRVRNAAALPIHYTLYAELEG